MNKNATKESRSEVLLRFDLSGLVNCALIISPTDGYTAAVVLLQKLNERSLWSCMVTGLSF